MSNNEHLENPNDLELPEDPGFKSVPPRLSFEHSVALCEKSLEWATSRPGFEERRYLSKCHAEFIL